ncbi:MAG: TolC family protein [Deltaproteobacteria bacterium]|nr:TolC family protein [Deltaproteobacteria bacterium]
MRSRYRIYAMGFIIIFVSFFSMNIAYADEKNTVYTLRTSIDEAIANNWALKAKTEKIDQAISKKNQARADFLPKLGTTYGYTRQSEQRTFRSTLATPGGPGIAVSSQDNYQWAGTISQPIFTGFGLLSAYQLAKLGIDQSQIGVDLEKIDLALRVKEAYFNILIADKAVDVAQKEVESLQSNLKVARSFYEVGMIPINDVLKPEVELGNAKQGLIRAENAAKVARSAFNIVLSKSINDPVDVEDILTFTPETGDFETYLEKALKARPEIKAIDVNILQTDQEIRLAKSKFYPEISFNYSYIKEGDQFKVDGSEFHDAGRWEATASATWTFWEWGKTYYSAKEKEGLKKELMQTRMSLQDSIRLDIKQALLDLETAEKNIPTTAKAVEQGEENLRVNEERYKAQVTTITEVLDAQTLLTQARVNYYRALYEHHLAKARLARSIGIL